MDAGIMKQSIISAHYFEMTLGIGGTWLWIMDKFSYSYKLNWYDFMYDIQYHYVKMNDLTF